MSPRLRTFAPTAILVAVLILTAAGSPTPGTDLDLEKIGREAAEAYVRNFAALHEVSFTRKVVRQSLGERGEVEDKEVILMRVTPMGEGFDERLIQLDGRPPTQREIRKHRKAGTFEKHYHELAEGRLSMSILGDLTLSLLLSTYDFHLAGEEEIHGVPCYRFSVRPSEEKEGADLSEQIAAASEGDFWISVEGSSLVRLKTRSVRPLKSFGMGLNAIELYAGFQPRGDVWVLERFEVKSEFSVLGTSRKHNIWTYSDYLDHP